MDVAEILVGFDNFIAQAVADSCASEGIEGHLLLREDPYNNLERVEHIYTVRAEDEPAVRRLIADLFPDLAIGQMADPTSGSVGRYQIVVQAALIVIGLLTIAAVAYALAI